MLNYHKIPEELKNLKQWVVANEKKIPISPKTLQPINIQDPSNYMTFNEVVNLTIPHIGFVLTDNDPYTCIDLDAPLSQDDRERQSEIIKLFDCYTERSQSGKGFHIFVKGKISQGVRRGRVEMYYSSRYMIMTGDIVNDKPIKEMQSALDLLYNDIRSKQNYIELNNYTDSEQLYSDSKIVDIASSAYNGEKFTLLCNGKWSGAYPSQSEADFALLSIICFYSSNDEQVKRIFRASELGKRPKAQRDDYLNNAIRSIRASLVADKVSTTQFNTTKLEPISKEEEPEKKEVEPLAEVKSTSLIDSLPDGLLKELTDYIYTSSIRPVEEISLAAALTFISGVISRAYNISHSGLNQYTLLIADTGTGKEGASSGIDRIIKAIEEVAPTVVDFIGPAGFASGPALLKVLNKKNCFFSILGEFGHTLINMSSPKANSTALSLKQVLLDIYQKSGKGSILKSMVYSDQEKNTAEIKSPSVTILGETTPGILYDNITQEVIEDGLLPRFNIINYDGKRLPRNKNAFSPPPHKLVNSLADMVVNALSIMKNNTCHEVEIQEEALKLFDDFDLKCDDKINTSEQEFIKHLWNRAHLKALKLAGICAVANNFYSPIVTPAIALWAIKFAEDNIIKIMGFFNSGVIGSEHSKKNLLVRTWIQQYLNMNLAKRLNYNIPANIAENAEVIPLAYLRLRARQNTKFFGKDNNYQYQLDNILKDLIEADKLNEIDKIVVENKFNSRSRLYAIGPMWKNEKIK